MIELISGERCTACNICVTICPTNVFDVVPDAVPVIARGADCQTCFMCELYCPVDALYVSPDAEAPAEVSEPDLIQANLLGSYRAAVGWTKATRDRRHVDAMFKLVKPL